MITDPLEALLNELGKALNIPALKPDRNRTCMLKMKGNVRIQLELDKDDRYLIIASDLGDIPLGRYRYDLMEIALKMNYLPPPRHGFFAFSRKTGHLVIFERLWMESLDGRKLMEEIERFREQALIWLEAIQHNELPVISEITTSGHAGIFGLRP